ncbi:hypothetical protein LTR37_002670 [Vermiconidia calcicola]|uniref:Uncharacterized protein n=1 Tax=Vermiconidia calcicola TaxID=1690605 RepID=A0ACC3NSC7_9PEZI|nr:hypothetical protein LTR37_002670 [Vermiconidia calcicola]
MVKKIELLVHAGAPSGRKDDDKYKAQAEAYLAFNGRVLDVPSSRASPTDLPNKGQDDRAGNVFLAMDRGDTAVLKHAPTVYLDDTQLAYTALDSQLLTSSLALPLDSPPGFAGRASCRSPNSQQNFERGERRSESRETASSAHKSSLSQDWAVKKRRGEDEAVQASNPGHYEPHAQDKAGDAHPPSQSSYLRSPVLDRSSKKQKVNNINHHPTAVPALPPYISLPENGRAGIAYVGEKPITSPEQAIPATTHASQQSGGGDESTSELPTSYSLGDITSESSRARQGVSQRSVSDPGPLPASISPTAMRAVPTPNKVHGIPKHAATQPAKDTHRAESSTNVPAHINDEVTTSKTEKQANDKQKGAPTHPDDQVTTSKTVKQANGRQKGVSTGLAAPQAKPQQLSPIPVERVRLLSTLSTTIKPPGPAASLEKYTTHVTDALRHLVENPDISHSYKPVSVARELRPLERGYWLIDCSPWDLELQIHFWQSLAKFIGDGRMGWGVWCTREQEGCSQSGESRIDTENRVNDGSRGNNGGAMQQLGIGNVKVFCWGEVVKHVFLLLYIASKSKVRKEGLQWIDAAEKVVVQMRTM